MDVTVHLPAGGSGPDGHREGTRRYRAVAKLGGGSFADILAAVNEEDPEDWTALKIEACYHANDMERRQILPSMVRFEYLVCREVACHLAATGVAQHCPCPVVYGCVCLHDEHDALAMELLGPDLRSYADSLGQWPLPEGIVLVFGAALVARLQQLHACGFIHRDLKPENVVFRLDSGQGQNAVPCLLLVDYALAMRYAGPNGENHVSECRAGDLAGTPRYMAIHTQQGYMQSRRSDLESLAHVLIELARGRLPWEHIADQQEMLCLKEKTSAAEACQGLLSPSFEAFLARCRALSFDERPDYQELQYLLLAGVTGPVDFGAGTVCRGFRNRLRRMYLKELEARSLQEQVATGIGHRRCLPSAVPLFVRHDARHGLTELVACHPSRAEELEDQRCFFFEAFRERLPGTVHVVSGSLHFFAFLQRGLLVAALTEAGLETESAQQILAFSHGRRDWVLRAPLEALPGRGQAAAGGVGSSKAVHRGWHQRSTFWARVIQPHLAVDAETGS